LPRSGAVAGGFCGALAAVPLLAAHFFRILLRTELQTDLKPFREIFAQATTAFQRLQRYEFLNSLYLFYEFYFIYLNLLQSKTYVERFFKGFAVQVSQPSNP
jgi:hypothetical protein